MSGPVVTIRTVKCARLTVTRNHPVLTGAGFLAACKVRKGYDLLVHNALIESFVSGAGDNRIPLPLPSGRAIDDKQPPARIEDAFNSLLSERARAPRLWTATGPALDFHGDAEFYQGNVHVVSINGMLPPSGEPGSFEALDHGNLVMNERPAGLSGHGGGSSLTAEACRLGVAADIHTTRLESVGQTRARGPEVLRELEQGYPSQVSLDKVVDVEVVSYSGHVFDLQSPFGWIVANGVFASNCRCTVRLVDKRELRDRGLLTEEGHVKPVGIAQARAFQPDEGFRKQRSPSVY